MRTSIRFVTPAFIALLGCGSVTVTPPGTTTGNSGGATTTSSNTAGGGGGSGGSCTGTCETTTTNSGGATTTSGSGTAGGGGAGGACTGACGTCVAAGAWSMAVTDAAGDVSPAETRSAMPDGGAMLATLLYTGVPPAVSTITRLDPAGTMVWTRSLNASVWAVAPDAACGVFIALTIHGGQTDLLGTSHACGAQYCAVVGRLDADGNPIWIRVYDPGPTKGAAPLHLAVTADRVVVRGIYHGTLDFGAGPMTGIPGSDSNQFIATLSSDGQGLWSRTISSPPPNDLSGGIAVTPDGDVAVNGGFVTTIDFGEGTIGDPAEGVHSRAFIAAYDPSGALRLSKVFDVGSTTVSWAVSRGSAGEIIAAGHGHGTMDVGGGPLGSPGQTSLIVAKLDQDGNHLWSTAYYPQPSCYTGLAVDEQGHIWAGGDGVVMELDGAGSTLEAHAIGGSGKRCVDSIGLRPDGRPIVMGTFKDVVDLGSGILSAGPHQGAFAGTLGP